jgi:HrpA-like RNA helicase
MVKRKDLRLVIMSATLEAEKFAEYFRCAALCNYRSRFSFSQSSFLPPPQTSTSSSAKVLYVAGRQFPVDVYYADEKEVQPLYLV